MKEKHSAVAKAIHQKNTEMAIRRAPHAAGKLRIERADAVVVSPPATGVVSGAVSGVATSVLTVVETVYPPPLLAV